MPIDAPLRARAARKCTAGLPGTDRQVLAGLYIARLLDADRLRAAVAAAPHRPPGEIARDLSAAAARLRAGEISRAWYDGLVDKIVSRPPARACRCAQDC